MKHFLVIAVTNKAGFFIFDTYEDFIVKADTKEYAEQLMFQSVPSLVTVDEIKEIKDPVPLMTVNKTKKINDNVTQLLIY